MEAGQKLRGYGFQHAVAVHATTTCSTRKRQQQLGAAWHHHCGTAQQLPAALRLPRCCLLRHHVLPYCLRGALCQRQ
jgi:hypothetical protein